MHHLTAASCFFHEALLLLLLLLFDETVQSKQKHVIHRDTSESQACLFKKWKDINFILKMFSCDSQISAVLI